jgi:hypothetical protein
MPSRPAIQVHILQRLMVRLRGRSATLWILAALVVVFSGGWPRVSAAANQDPLLKARLLYNQRQYDAAIDAALEARKLPGNQDVANLVLGRSRLERYRESQNSDDLTAGRDALRAVHPAHLVPRDQLDLLIGLGQSLYFENAFGAAAELWDSALARAEEIGPTARDRLLDWWASALDRAAQSRLVEDRDPIYTRILDRAQAELGRDPGGAAAAYWQAAACRALGDLDRAWEAVQAAWLRSLLNTDHAAAMRDDLDRLMLEAIIPERARKWSGPDFQSSADLMKAEWEAFKANWTPK